MSNATVGNNLASYRPCNCRKMKIIRVITVFSAVIAAFSSLSCMKDNTLLYNNVTMGNVVNGEYVSDQGNIFHIVSQSCAGRIDTMGRALTICDVLNRTAGSGGNEYDVRVNYMHKVLVKDVIAEENADDDAKTEHPVRIEKAWISGGYLNIYISFPYNPANRATHMVNLMQQASEESGTYRFRLTHNAFEDAVTGDGTEGWQISGGYVSFPINALIVEDEARLRISWKGFSPDNFLLTEDCEVQATYRKGGFEQAPAIAAMSRALI